MYRCQLPSTYKMDDMNYESNSSPEVQSFHHSPAYSAPLATGLDETEGRRLLMALDKLKHKLQRETLAKLERHDQGTSYSENHLTNDRLNMQSTETRTSNNEIGSSPATSHHSKESDRLSQIERQLETIVHLINHNQHHDSGRDSVSGSPLSGSNCNSNSPTSSSPSAGGSVSPTRLPPPPPTPKSSHPNERPIDSLQTDLSAVKVCKISRATETDLIDPQVQSTGRRLCPKHGTQSVCQLESQRQAAAAKSISCRHYHFNIKEVPFVPASKGQSYSSVAKAQNLLAELRSSGSGGRLSKSTTFNPVQTTVKTPLTASTQTDTDQNNNNPKYETCRQTQDRVTKKSAKPDRLNSSELEMKMLHAELDDLLFELREEQHFIAEEIDALMERLGRAPTARIKVKLQSEVELLESRLRTKQKQIVDLKRVCDDFVRKYSQTLVSPFGPKADVDENDDLVNENVLDDYRATSVPRVESFKLYESAKALPTVGLRRSSTRTVRFVEPDGEERVPKWI